MTPAQQVALEALVAGTTQREAVEAAGVSRETFTRWSGHVPAFKPTLNLYRTVVAAEQSDATRRVLGKALNAVEAALAEGRV